MTIEDLGYSEFFELGRKKVGLDSFAVARVVEEHRELYRVVNATGEYTAKITGKQMFEASGREDYPAVGDWVAITVLNDEQAVIEGVIPRKTVIRRKESGGSGTQIIASNVDVAFIVQSVGRNFNINRFERYASLVTSGGVRPSIILNKSDLASASELDSMVSRIKERLPEIEVTTVSTVTEEGLSLLAKRLVKGETYCFVGSSGVGKSSIINKLFGVEILTTGQISSRTNKGMHVTTSRALIMLGDGAMVIDTPGMRELGVLDSETGIGQVFDEIVEAEKSCRFSDCTHTTEPGCAVQEAIKSGVLDKNHYESYEKLKKENDFHNLDNLEKRNKDRSFGKFIKKAKEQIEKYK